jgi:RimJ/RimL family protein N-acetyltransferase
MGFAPLTQECFPDPVTDLHTEQLILRPLDTDEAERIVARQPGTQDSWAQDFPFDGDVAGVTMFLRATAAHGDQYPFGHYVIIRTADGQAIGGIGFKGQPADGTVEIGYGSPHQPVEMATPPRPRMHSSNSLANRG